MKKVNNLRKTSSAETSRPAAAQEAPREAVDSGMSLARFDGDETPSAANEQRGPRADGYDQDTIRRRAYELYLNRNGAEGDADADWFAAEQEIRGQRVSAD